MSVVITAGALARVVTSAAEVDLLTASATGVALTGVRSWSLMITTTQDVTVRVYKAAGVNCGFVLLSSLTAVVTSAAPRTIEASDEANVRLRVTAQATATAAAVNCDLRAVSL